MATLGTLVALICCLSVQAVACRSMDDDKQIGNLRFQSESNWTAAQFPHPDDNREQCNMEQIPASQVNYICNTDNLITSNQARRLNDLIIKSLSRTRCACELSTASSTKTCHHSFPTGKFSISIALPYKVVSSTGDGGGGTLMRQFAESLYSDRWQTMNRCDDGIVIVVQSDGTVYSEIGGVAQHFINGDCQSKILTNVTGEFGNNRIYDGLSNLIKYYGNALGGGVCGEQPTDDGLTWWQWLLISLAIIVGLILLCVLMSVIGLMCKCCDCLFGCFKCILRPFKACFRCICCCGKSET